MSSHPKPNRTPVSFQDVAASFSKAERKLLHDWQKELYKAVMTEIHQALVSLGPAIAASVFLFSEEENEDLVLVDIQDSETYTDNLSPRKEVTKEIASESMIDNQDADTMGFQSSMEIQNVHYPTEVSCIVSVVGEGMEEITSITPGVSYVVSESESCCMDPTDAARRDESIAASSEHQSDRESTNGNQSRFCCECKKKCTWDVTLEQHQGNHGSNDSFRCTDCEKRFSNKSPLQREQRIKSDLKSFPCTECGKTFFHKTNFLHHQRIHTGVKPFSCTECDKSFAQKINLITHQKIHTRERPFHCTVCTQSFCVKSHLLEHLKIHTVKTFSCNQCKKTFTNEPALSLHMRIHTGLRPFPCTLCSKSFTCKSYLLRHMKTHTKSNQAAIYLD